MMAYIKFAGLSETEELPIAEMHWYYERLKKQKKEEAQPQTDTVEALMNAPKAPAPGEKSVEIRRRRG